MPTPSLRERMEFQLGWLASYSKCEAVAITRDERNEIESILREALAQGPRPDLVGFGVCVPMYEYDTLPKGLVVRSMTPMVALGIDNN